MLLFNYFVFKHSVHYTTTCFTVSFTHIIFVFRLVLRRSRLFPKDIKFGVYNGEEECPAWRTNCIFIYCLDGICGLSGYNYFFSVSLLSQFIKTTTFRKLALFLFSDGNTIFLLSALWVQLPSFRLQEFQTSALFILCKSVLPKY
jgi:hypothetical protein